MNKHVIIITFLFIMAIHFQGTFGMQQNHNPEQLVQQALSELPQILAEFAKPIIQNNLQPQNEASNSNYIETYKRRFQGAPLNRICASISVGQDRLHAQRSVQEVLGHVMVSTADAQQIALQEQFEQKAGNLANTELARKKAEQELGILQEIKQKKVQQKVKTAEYEKVCKDLNFLTEQKDLDDKLDLLARYLNSLDFKLTAEIMATEQAIRELKWLPIENLL